MRYREYLWYEYHFKVSFVISSNECSDIGCKIITPDILYKIPCQWYFIIY